MRTILIDTGHLPSTPGKCSPDGLFREHDWTLAVGDELERMLNADGIPVWRVPHHTGMTDRADLRARVRAANTFARGRDCALVSIHCNAAGMGDKWHNARGWSVFVAPNASRESRRLATMMAEYAAGAGLTVRKPAPGRLYWEASLAICRDTVMPAILVEHLFMDNPDDLQLLLSPNSVTQAAAIYHNFITENFRTNN